MQGAVCKQEAGVAATAVERAAQGVCRPGPRAQCQQLRAEVCDPGHSGSNRGPRYATRRWESLIEVTVQEEQTRALFPVSRLMEVRCAFQYKPVPFCVCKRLRVKERDSHRVWRAWERADQEAHHTGLRQPTGQVSQVGR